MTISAKYPGKCGRCGGAIRVGELIEWERGRGAWHVQCPETPVNPPAAEVSAAEAVALVRGGVQRPAGRNRRPGYCDHCGTYLEPGKGRLERCLADTGCLKHHDSDGWHLYCLDEKGCAERRRQDAERKAAEEAARQRFCELIRGAVAVGPDEPEGWSILTDRFTSMTWVGNEHLGLDGQGRVWLRRWRPGGSDDWEPEFLCLPVEVKDVLELASRLGFEVRAGAIEKRDQLVTHS